MTTTTAHQKGKLDKSGVNRIAQVLVSTIILAMLLFGCAGRLDWWHGWAFFAIYVGGIVANATWTLRHNPEVINERGRVGKNAKSWDKVIGVFYLVFLSGLLMVAGLDARYHWSAVPLGLNLLGLAGVGFGMAMTFWVMKVNTFLTTFVRIQQERGQYTVTTGPYRIVRHPMYAGNLVMFLGMPILLGSWWALIPGILNILVMVIRTALEDRTLQAELAGYLEYTRRVRYRLIPGIW